MRQLWKHFEEQNRQNIREREGEKEREREEEREKGREGWRRTMAIPGCFIFRVGKIKIMEGKAWIERSVKIVLLNFFEGNMWEGGGAGRNLNLHVGRSCPKLGGFYWRTSGSRAVLNRGSWPLERSPKSTEWGSEGACECTSFSSSAAWKSNTDGDFNSSFCSCVPSVISVSLFTDSLILPFRSVSAPSVEPATAPVAVPKGVACCDVDCASPCPWDWAWVL